MLDIEAFLKLMEIKYFDDKETGVLNIGSEQPQSIIYEYDIR